ncbi:nitrogen fixation protein NifQ [Derxia lacustris]|uniref:nitrogen fixation protein NifQ n=1 Tax=Derxia lacustris TaxID=764842 RepID=UPI001F24C62F|nr:nitrogen fixation protein NifQ [Derxia lacustris]
MEAALARLLADRFGTAEADRIEARWCQTFDLVPGERGELMSIPDRHEEYADLLELLLDAVVLPGEGGAALARWLAYSCMGEGHLWEDLGLPERPELTRLMADCFPRLRAANSQDMRWKKFFYKQLCDRAEVSVCRAPSCSVCSEYSVCFVNPILPSAALLDRLSREGGAPR